MTNLFNQQPSVEWICPPFSPSPINMSGDGTDLVFFDHILCGLPDLSMDESELLVSALHCCIYFSARHIGKEASSAHLTCLPGIPI